MANQKHNFKHLFRRSADPQDLDDQLSDGIDSANYFKFVSNPHEPGLSGHRNLSVRFKLSLANRHHLKNRVWKGRVNKLHHA